MRPLTGIRAVLFDMDGTLVDSDAAVERAWRTWSAEYGVDGARAAAVGVGNPAATTIRLLLPRLSDEEVAAAADREHELQYDDLADVTATPGAGRLLAILARLAPGLEAGHRAGATTAALRGLSGDLPLSSLDQLADLLAR